MNLPFKLELCLIIYIIPVSDEFETGALDLDHQDYIGLQTSTVLEKIELFFITPSNLNCEQVKHHKVPRLLVGTKKWQSVRRHNGSGCVEICRENASAVNMEPDGSLKLRVED